VSDQTRDPLAADGHRLAVASLIAAIRDDDLAIGVLLEEFEPSVLTHALMHAVAIAADFVRHGAAEHDIPADRVADVFRAGLFDLG
jgi:hypothetical protein